MQAKHVDLARRWMQDLGKALRSLEESPGSLPALGPFRAADGLGAENSPVLAFADRRAVAPSGRPPRLGPAD